MTYWLLSHGIVITSLPHGECKRHDANGFPKDPCYRRDTVPHGAIGYSVDREGPPWLPVSRHQWFGSVPSEANHPPDNSA